MDVDMDGIRGAGDRDAGKGKAAVASYLGADVDVNVDIDYSLTDGTVPSTSMSNTSMSYAQQAAVYPPINTKTNSPAVLNNTSEGSDGGADLATSAISTQPLVNEALKTYNPLKRPRGDGDDINGDAVSMEPLEPSL
jgi:hypothetical protein